MAADTTNLPPLIFEETKVYNIGEAAVEAMAKDIAELKELGFDVPAIRIRGENAVRYDLSPPKGGMHTWRQQLEKAGFEVVSRLKQEELGFSASRRAVQGEGWK